MRPNLYKAARALTTAGCTAQIHFNPSSITNRLKKSIQRQITSCAITGGYSSHAARIAKQLMSQSDIPYSDGHWSSVQVQLMTEEHQNKAVAIVQADLAAYLLEDRAYNSQYEKNRAARSIESIKTGQSCWVGVNSREASNQLLQLMAESLTPEIKAKAKELADRLDDPTPIKLTIKDWS